MAVVRDKRLRLHVRSGMHGSITESILGRSYNMGQARRLALSLAPAPYGGFNKATPSGGGYLLHYSHGMLPFPSDKALDKCFKRLERNEID